MNNEKHVSYDDPTLGDRILARVRHTISNCWLWQNTLTKDGFGQIQEKLASGKWRTWSAHRAAYELFEGPIPDGLELVPDRRGCVNPAHMRLFTPRGRVHRPDNKSLPSRNLRKRSCRKGHRLTPANTYTTTSGNRGCVTCRKEYYLEHRDQLLAEAKSRYRHRTPGRE